MSKCLGKSTKLLESVKQRSMSMKVGEDEDKKNPVCYLDKDCISNILMKLPFESLPSSRFICKTWYGIINSISFIEKRFVQSESVLIYLKPVPTGTSYPYSHAPSTSSSKQEANNFSVEDKLLQSQPINLFALQSARRSIQFSINFIKFSEGKGVIGDYGINCLGKIRAVCNGFILLDNILKNGGLLVMNPVTRKLLALPVGTLSEPHKESYGFASMNASSSGYKLVHLFMDDMKYVGCEILNLGSRSWNPVNGPPSWMFPRFGYHPILAIGALHWLPQIDGGSNSMVSLELDTDKFHVIPLPKISGAHDRILKMGDLLCFVTHEDLDIDIWKMKSVCRGDQEWTKYHKITRGSLIDMVPLFSLRIKGDVVFKRHEDGSIYSYEFESQTMTMIEMDKKLHYNGWLLPHVNNLGSWTMTA
ncbi:hypothetical protein LINPERHAP2_LOCUS16072 [Linum perenne]